MNEGRRLGYIVDRDNQSYVGPILDARVQNGEFSRHAVPLHVTHDRNVVKLGHGDHDGLEASDGCLIIRIGNDTVNTRHEQVPAVATRHKAVPGREAEDTYYLGSDVLGRNPITCKHLDVVHSYMASSTFEIATRSLPYR